MDIYSLFDYFKRYFPWLNLLAISLLAFLSASLFSGYLSHLLSSIPMESPRISRKSSDHAKTAPLSLNDYQSISDRNIFTLLPPDKTENPVAAAAAADKSPLKARLIGTITGPRDRSLALVEDETTRTAEFYKIGEMFMTQATVLVIERNRIVISRAGNQEVLAIYEEEISPLTSTSSSLPPPTLPSGNGPVEVRKVAENRFEINRLAFEEVTKNLGTIMTQARIVPHFIEGKIAGYKIFAIKPDSIYTDLGMVNGDVLQKVNGVEIESPEKALQIISQLKTETDFQIDVVRNGKPMTFSYRLR
jgi:general secretion pathway protein C